jgi:hypothetical protein
LHNYYYSFTQRIARKGNQTDISIMFARGKSKDRTSSRKVTPPSPSYMSNDQFGTAERSLHFCDGRD